MATTSAPDSGPGPGKARRRRFIIAGLLLGSACIAGAPALGATHHPREAPPAIILSPTATQANVDQAVAFLAARGIDAGQPTIAYDSAAGYAVATGNSDGQAGRTSLDPTVIHVAPGTDMDSTDVLHEVEHVPDHIANCDVRASATCAMEEGSVQAVAEDLAPAFDRITSLGYTTGGTYVPQVKWIRQTSGAACGGAGLDPAWTHGCARAWRLSFVAAGAQDRAAMAAGSPPISLEGMS